MVAPVSIVFPIIIIGTALDRVLLLPRNGAGFLQVLSQVGDTPLEVVVVARARGAGRHQVSNRAARGEHGIGGSRIAAMNNDGGTEIGIGALILSVRHAIAIVVGAAGRGRGYCICVLLTLTSANVATSVRATNVCSGMRPL